MSRPRERWIVSEDEALGQVLERFDASAALADGRVFVAGRRALDAATRVLAGEAVEVYAAREASELPLTVLHASDGLIVVDKPAGIATEPERRGSRGTVVARVAEQLGLDASRVHALSRLDLGVSGVVLLATTASANERVAALRRAGRVRRRYLALAAGAPGADRGTFTDPIRKRAGSSLREIHASGEPALTHYRVVARSRRTALLAFEPETGRTHQLRVHAAAHEAPLLGDGSYGGPSRWVAPDGSVTGLERIFLHAAWVEAGELARVTSTPPTAFGALFRDDGGDPEELARALSIEVRP